MSFNLVDSVKSQLNVKVLGQLGKILGGNAKQNGTAINSAIPGLLYVLGDKANSKKNATSLLSVIEKQDENILDNLSDVLAGIDRSTLMHEGIKSIGTLMGKNDLIGFIGALSGFSGSKKSTTGSLVGLLTPIIFGVIKRKLLSSGSFDAGSLLNLFNDQKENVVKAMLLGFSDSLKSSGFKITDFSVKQQSSPVDKEVPVPVAKKKATPKVKEIPTATKNEVVDKTQEVSSEKKPVLAKLLTFGVLVGGAVLAYSMFFKDGTSENLGTTATSSVSPSPNPTSTSVSPSPNPTPISTSTNANVNSTVNTSVAASSTKMGNAVGLENDLKNTLGSLTSSLESITDVNSAKAALADLTSGSNQLGSMAAMMNKLPEASKGPIKSVVNKGLPQMQALLNKISIIPGVGAVVRPVIISLSERLALFK